MSTQGALQLALPARWAQRAEAAAAHDRLAALERDLVETKARLRAVLDRLAERHAIAPRDVTCAVHGYLDDLLSDLAYPRRREIEREIERQSEP